LIFGFKGPRSALLKESDVMKPEQQYVKAHQYLHETFIEAGLEDQLIPETYTPAEKAWLKCVWLTVYEGQSLTSTLLNVLSVMPVSHHSLIIALLQQPLLKAWLQRAIQSLTAHAKKRMLKFYKNNSSEIYAAIKVFS
tara:strand:+ start:744 stop:1157 length:414 start_codon:yes stop_codon:yes gene_type:complete